MADQRDRVLDELVRVLPVWQLAAMRFNDAIARGLGVNSSDLQCLFVLDRAGASTVGAIAHRVGLTTGSTSRMVERLVAAGLVSRDTDSHDRRRVVVTIRPEASRHLHGLYDPLDVALRDRMAELPTSSLRHLRRFAEDAARVTDEMTGG